MKTINLSRYMIKDYFRDSTMVMYGLLFNPVLYLIIMLIARSRGYSSYGSTIFNGILIMSVLTIALFNFPIMLSDFSERGLNKKLHSTPINSSEFFVSITVTHMAMMVCSLIPVYIMGFIVGLEGKTLSPLFILTIIIFGVVMIAASLFIVSFFREIAALKSLSNILYLYFIALGDIFFSIDKMHQVFKVLAYINPVYHMTALLKSILNGGNVNTANFSVPLLWMFISLIVFSINFRKVMQYE